MKKILKATKFAKQPSTPIFAVVLAKYDGKFVTWIWNFKEGGYYGGHYFTKYADALRDYVIRVAEEKVYYARNKMDWKYSEKNPLTKGERDTIRNLEKINFRSAMKSPYGYKKGWLIGKVDAYRTVRQIFGDEPYSPRDSRGRYKRLTARRRNPLTNRESARMLKMAKSHYLSAHRGDYRPDYMMGIGEGLTNAVHMGHGSVRAKNLASKLTKKYYRSHIKTNKYIYSGGEFKQTNPPQTVADFVVLLLTEVYAGSKGVHGGMPEGHFYAKHMMHLNLDAFHRVRDIARAKGFITVKGYLMKPTPKLIAFVEND